MIIGNGLIGTEFHNSDYDFSKFVIFASGVSSSKETSKKEFKREKELIEDTIKKYPDLKFIYFSSILASSSSNEYYIHNLKMEELVKNKCEKYIIFKLPQIIGVIGNKDNLINHLIKSIIDGKKIDVHINVKRALVDVSDIVDIVNYCKNKISNSVVEISNIEKVNVIDLCLSLASIMDKKLDLSISKSDESDNWNVNNHVIIDDAIKFLGIKEEGYTDRVLKKYIKK